MTGENIENAHDRKGGDKRLFFAAAIMVFSAAIVFYARTASYDFVYDDHVIVTEEKAIRDISPQGIKNIFLYHNYQNYLPVRMLVYGAVYKFFGLDPSKFHALNIFLNAANCLLVFLLCSALLGMEEGRAGPALRGNLKTATATAAALLFLTHPIHVESVAWVSGLKELLSAFFSLLAILFFIHLRSGGGRKVPSWAFHFTIIFFILAALSKATAVFLPFAFILIDIAYPEKARRSAFIQRALEYLFLFSALAIIVALNYALSVKYELIMPLNGGSRLNHALTIFKLFAFHIKSIAVPTGLSVIYDIAPVTTFASAKLVAALIGCAAYAAVFLYYLRKKPIVSFGLGYFALAMLPALNVIPIYVKAADRYAYQALAGLCVACAASMASFAPEGVGKKKIASVVLSAALAIFAALSLQRMPVWQSDIQLWKATLAKMPDSPKALVGMGDAHILRKEYDIAIPFYKKALAIDRGYIKAYIGYGWCLREKGDLQSAYNVIKTAMRYDINNMEIYYYYAILLYDIGETASAARLFILIETELPGYRETRQRLVAALRVMKNNMPSDEYKEMLKRLKPPKSVVEE